MGARNGRRNVSAFPARARARLEEAEHRLLIAKAAACFHGLAFLNGRLLDTVRLDDLSRQITLAERECERARAALARLEPDPPRFALPLPRALELFIGEIERLAAHHGLDRSHWPQEDLLEMAEELILHQPAVNPSPRMTP